MASAKKSLDEAEATEVAEAVADRKARGGDGVAKAAVIVEPAPTKKAAKPHHTTCVVEGSPVVSGDRTYDVGAVDEFPDSDVASLPDNLIPVTE